MKKETEANNKTKPKKEAAGLRTDSGSGGGLCGGRVVMLNGHFPDAVFVLAGGRALCGGSV